MKIIFVLVLQGSFAVPTPEYEPDSLYSSGSRSSGVESQERGAIPEPEPVGENFEPVIMEPQDRLSQARRNLFSSRIVALIDFGISMSVRNFLNQTEEIQQEECENAYASSIETWNTAFESYCKQLIDMKNGLDSDFSLSSQGETGKIHGAVALVSIILFFSVINTFSVISSSIINNRQ